MLPMFSSSTLPYTEISPPLEAEKNSSAENLLSCNTLLLSPILLVLPTSFSILKVSSADPRRKLLDGLLLSWPESQNQGKKAGGAGTAVLAERKIRGEVIRYGHGGVAEESWLG